MPINLQGKSLLTLSDFSSEEIMYLINLALDFKSKKNAKVRGHSLEGLNIVLIFEKNSTRTRCAFEVATHDEGGHLTFLTHSQLGTKESIEDSAHVLGRYYDGIGFRGFKQETVENLSRHAGVPVWNALTEMYHPTQVLADLITLKEHLQKPFSQMKLCFVGDARNNMGHSLMIAAAKMGMHFTALAEKSLFPSPSIQNYAQQEARKTGATITVTDDITHAVQGVDALYTDAWASLGEQEKWVEHITLLQPYRVDKTLMEKTGNPEALFMHCLPAFHDTETELVKQIKAEHQLDAREVTDDVFRSRYSVVFDQAENRMHSIKALMAATCGHI